MKKIIAILAGAFVLASCASNEKAELQQIIDENLAFSADQAMVMAAELFPEENSLPRTFEDGALKRINYGHWVSGFYPGVLWQLAERFPERRELKLMAQEFTKRVAPAQWMTNTHDLGFMIFCSFGNGYRITGDESYLEVIHNACNSLITRYNDTTKTILSWDPFRGWQFPVIIDNMMNLEMLMWASEKFDEPRYAEISNNHAQTTIANHFREDFSTYHVVSYDKQTGVPEAKQTQQGYADDSAWARGQAWGLYGYTMMYRMTGNEDYLAQARAIANFIESHPRLPEDGIPYWDFDCPEIPDTYRDASAGAIIASSLLELSTLDKSSDAKRWKKLAVKQIRSLASPAYRAEAGENSGFILKHSVGHLGAGNEVDVPLTYADYYFIEALLRLEKML